MVLVGIVAWLVCAALSFQFAAVWLAFDVVELLFLKFVVLRGATIDLSAQLKMALTVLVLNQVLFVAWLGVLRLLTPTLAASTREVFGHPLFTAVQWSGFAVWAVLCFVLLFLGLLMRV